MKFYLILFSVIVIAVIIFVSGLKPQPYNISVLEFDNLSSNTKINILWANPKDPYLQRLRLTYSLDDLVKDSKNDYDRILKVTHWVNNLWEHDGNNHPSVSDPISILELVEKGNRYACVEYSIVLAGTLNSLGIQTRVLALKTSDVETRKLGAGHVVVEAYVEHLSKWTMIDGQMDAIPTLDGIPLNAVEFQQALASNHPNLSIDSLDSSGIAMAPNIGEYFEWIAPYLYYFDTPLDNKIFPSKLEDRLKGRLMLVPVGAKKPTVFQQKTTLKNFTYTHSVDTFYQKPDTQQ